MTDLIEVLGEEILAGNQEGMILEEVQEEAQEIDQEGMILEEVQEEAQEIDQEILIRINIAKDQISENIQIKEEEIISIPRYNRVNLVFPQHWRFKIIFKV